jgi:3-deoxy-7-phosphoheptulonate synthase
MMREAADKKRLLVCSEVMDASQIQLMLPYVDIFQVGARNMQNYFLLRALGTTSKPVLLKRGMSATIEELLLSAEYIMAGGNHNVILCERGIRTFETATRNTLDIAAIPVIKKLSHLPIRGRPIARHRNPRQGSPDGARLDRGRRRRLAPRSAQRSRARAFRWRAIALFRSI